MTDLILVDYERLEKLAAVFGQQSENIAQMLQQVQGSVNPLQAGGWMGKGSDAFFGEMEGVVLPAVQRLIEALGEANLVTRQIIEVMQQADEEASASFRAGGAAGAGGLAGGSAGGGAAGGLGGISGGLGRLEGLINGIGFGGSGTGSGAGSLAGSLFGSGLPGGGFGGGLFGGDVFAGGSFGFGLAGSNDFGIPQDWLSGVTDSLNGYVSDNYNDYGIPKDWLSDVMGGGGSGSTSSVPSGGSGSSGGGAGSELAGGSGGGSGGSEPMSTGGGGSGSGSSPTTDVRDPYGRGNIPRSFGGSMGTVASADVAQPGGLRYQSLGTSGGGAGGGAFGNAPTAAGAFGVVAPAAAGSPSNFGLSLGLAAASPFLALLGKAIKNSGDD